MDEQTIKRINDGFSDSHIGPETLALMLTKVCNLSCIYCRGGRAEERYKTNIDISDELSTEDLFSLFEDARDFQVKEINLGGMDGEPFCKKDIMKIIAKIKTLGFMGSITTNGSFLNTEIARELTDYGWDILLLSFDSYKEAIQHITRPAISKKPYLSNIMQFLDTLKYINSNLRVLLNVVITKFNYKDLPELVKFANHYNNIESINILKMLNMGLTRYDEMQLNNSELEEFKNILSILRNEKKIAYQRNWLDTEDKICSQVSLAKDFRKCFTNYYILSIDSNGDILHCPQYQRVVGRGFNVKNTSLKELWCKDLFEFRRKLAENADCFEACCTILKEQNKRIFDFIESV